VTEGPPSLSLGSPCKHSSYRGGVGARYRMWEPACWRWEFACGQAPTASEARRCLCRSHACLAIRFRRWIAMRAWTPAGEAWGRDTGCGSQPVGDGNSLAGKLPQRAEPDAVFVGAMLAWRSGSGGESPCEHGRPQGRRGGGIPDVGASLLAMGIRLRASSHSK